MEPGSLRWSCDRVCPVSSWTGSPSAAGARRGRSRDFIAVLCDPAARRGSSAPYPGLRSPNIGADSVDDSFVQPIKAAAREGAALAAASSGLWGIAENRCLPKAKWTVPVEETRTARLLRD